VAGTPGGLGISGIATEVVENGLRTWHPLEVLGWLIANGENALFDLWSALRIRGLASRRRAEEDGEIACGRAAKALDPLFDKAERSTDGSGELGLRPVGMSLSQAVQESTISNPSCVVHRIGSFLREGRLFLFKL
jgi:hypothetical protein